MEKIIGIVSEYNPFHSGHRFHIEESRKRLQTDSANPDVCPFSVKLPDRKAEKEQPLVICCMSGDFVQRGEWAILPKHERAALAVKGGADLVVELPLPWSLSSAEGFAAGAVQILASMGITHLSFGSESGDIEELTEAARRIDRPGFQQEISDYMKKHPEHSYASARGAVLTSENNARLCKLLESPNNLLGIEYLRALKRFPQIQVLTVPRGNSAHDGINSAMELRISMRERGEGVREDLLNLAALSRLRSLDRNSFASLRDGENGVGERIYAAIRSGASTVDEICQRAKTRSIPYSRLRRVTMRAVLGLRKELYEPFPENSPEAETVYPNAAATYSLPPYSRVLAANERGRKYLAQLRKKENGLLPLVTLPKEMHRLDPFSQKVFAAGAYAKDFYNLGIPEKVSVSCGEDWRLHPVMA